MVHEPERPNSCGHKALALWSPSPPGFYNGHRPHRSLGQAAPMRPRPDNVIDLEEFRVRRRDRAGGLLHEYRQVA